MTPSFGTLDSKTDFCVAPYRNVVSPPSNARPTHSSLECSKKVQNGEQVSTAAQIDVSPAISSSGHVGRRECNAGAASDAVVFAGAFGQNGIGQTSQTQIDGDETASGPWQASETRMW